MKTYKKTYYFDNGNHINIFSINKNFEEIMKEINKSLAADFTNETVDNVKCVTINMNKVNYIVVEEIKSDNKVEILENEKKIPEKLNIEQNSIGNHYIKNEFGTQCNLTKHSKIIADKINEILDYLKNKGE